MTTFVCSRLLLDATSSLHPALVATIKKLQTGYISGTRFVVIIPLLIITFLILEIVLQFKLYFVTFSLFVYMTQTVYQVEYFYLTKYYTLMQIKMMMMMMITAHIIPYINN